jgi:hypothetical protein
LRCRNNSGKRLETGSACTLTICHREVTNIQKAVCGTQTDFAEIENNEGRRCAVNRRFDNRK